MPLPKLGVKFSGGYIFYLVNKLESQSRLNSWICEVGRIDNESEFSFEIQQPHSWQTYNWKQI